MSVPRRTQLPLRLIVGCCCLLVCIAAGIVGAPVYETTIDHQAPSEQAMAAALDVSSPDEIEPIAFSTLSPAEQTAVSAAVASPKGVYTDRGHSDAGTQLTYRNDVVTQYVISYQESFYLVRAVVTIRYLLVVGAVLGGGVGFLLVVSGVRAWRS